MSGLKHIVFVCIAGAICAPVPVFSQPPIKDIEEVIPSIPHKFTDQDKAEFREYVEQVLDRQIKAQAAEAKINAEFEKMRDELQKEFRPAPRRRDVMDAPDLPSGEQGVSGGGGQKPFAAPSGPGGGTILLEKRDRTRHRDQRHAVPVKNTQPVSSLQMQNYHSVRNGYTGRTHGGSQTSSTKTSSDSSDPSGPADPLIRVTTHGVSVLRSLPDTFPSTSATVPPASDFLSFCAGSNPSSFPGPHAIFPMFQNILHRGILYAGTPFTGTLAGPPANALIRGTAEVIGVVSRVQQHGRRLATATRRRGTMTRTTGVYPAIPMSELSICS